MSRTYRNRRSAPKGWTVRDDGIPYYGGDDAFGHDLLSIEIGYSKPRPRFRRSWHRKERKCYRHIHWRSFRAKVKDCIRNERFDDIPRFRRTGGWLTW